MRQSNGHGLPFLIAGGGIGGLVAAYALALKGFPVRVLEQADEFREIGAGIQLGPNIFQALDKIGLKDAMLADAWRPGRSPCAAGSPARSSPACRSAPRRKRFSNSPMRSRTAPTSTAFF